LAPVKEEKLEIPCYVITLSYKLAMRTREEKTEAWQLADSERFWRQIAREQHILHTYSDTDDLISTLFTFVDDGFKSNDAVLLISTSEHRQMLDDRLRQEGHNVFSLRLRDQYICIDALEMLAEFTINGKPDPLLFSYTVTDLVQRARRSRRHVRAFGEMVAILWSDGNREGAIALEKLWNNYLDMEPFTLLCAYPDKDTAGVNMFEDVHHAHRRCLAPHQSSGEHVVFRSA
jgi:hypothetical protein